MSFFARAASKIRHSPLLEKSDWLWNGLRKPYHKILNYKNNGVLVRVNDSFSYRISPEYYAVGLEDYELENVEQLIAWISSNPNCMVLDIGCSLGIMSAISLTASKNARVIAFDSDIASLKATQRVCKYVPSKKLELIYGLIGENSTVTTRLNKAIADTNKILSETKLTGDPGTTTYANIDLAEEGTPMYSIDDLFKQESINTPILIKCDIEGAELFALKGSANFIKRYKPAILLSVHPGILPVFGADKNQVSDFLKDPGYSIQIIGIDHEEHWWCLAD